MNLADELQATARRRPDATAIRSPQRILSYAELDAEVDAAAGALAGMGVRRGDRVALLLGNTETFAVALYGVWRAGGVAVPVNPEFTAAEVGHQLVDSGATALIVGRARHRVVTDLRDRLPDVEHVLVADAAQAPPGTGMGSWRDALARGGTVPDAAADETGLALLQYTAGTTGRPRGAMLTHGNLLANHRQMRATPIAPTDVDVVLCSLPLFHVYALNVGLCLSLHSGAEIVLTERFDPRGTLDAIQAHGVTIVLGAPPMYVAWVNTPGADEADLSSVRLATSGASALSPRLLARCADELGLVVWEGYGLTETSPALTSTVMLDSPVPGAVGPPLPGVEMRIVDPAGHPAHTGDPGHVQVRGDNVFQGYWRDEGATAGVLDDDGWFDTGDIGFLDDDGVLFLVDRARDLIIVSGFNVYPREVEEALVTHPDVDQAAVVGVPHPYTGETVKAVVVRRRGSEVTGDEVIAHAATRLARFKCPEVVEFVDALPVLPTGKLRRAALRGAAG